MAAHEYCFFSKVEAPPTPPEKKPIEGGTDYYFLDLGFHLAIKDGKLDFPFMSVSDIHLGSRQCRAKRTAAMLGRIKTEKLFCVGDIIDLEHMKKKPLWKFAPWHTEVLASFFRMAAHDTEVTYLPGNHDLDVRQQTIMVREHIDHGFDDSRERVVHKAHHNLCGKTIHNIKVRDEILYTDPKSRKILVMHGDKLDEAIFGQNTGLFYTIGNSLYDLLTFCDDQLQLIPRCDQFSVAAIGKRITKKIIENCLGGHKALLAELGKKDNVNGLLYGHTHMPHITKTPSGQIIINDGCCTEHVQTAVHDQNGHWAILEWHKKQLIITAENGNSQTVTWQELGLPNLVPNERPEKDLHTQAALDIQRILYRLAPPQERIKARKIRKIMIRHVNHVNRENMPPIPLPTRVRQPRRCNPVNAQALG